MKKLLLLITIMLVGGCGKDKEAQTKTKVTEDNNATKPVRKLTAEEKALRDSVVGEYVAGPEGQGKHKWVLLENGVIESWTCQFIKRKEEWVHGVWEKRKEYKWSIVNKEIHVDYGDLDWNGVVGIILVYRINKDKSITRIADIQDGERIDDESGEAVLLRYATSKKIK